MPLAGWLESDTCPSRGGPPLSHCVVVFCFFSHHLISCPANVKAKSCIFRPLVSHTPQPYPFPTFHLMRPISYCTLFPLSTWDYATWSPHFIFVVGRIEAPLGRIGRKKLYFSQENEQIKRPSDGF